MAVAAPRTAGRIESLLEIRPHVIPAFIQRQVARLSVSSRVVALSFSQIETNAALTESQNTCPDKKSQLQASARPSSRIITINSADAPETIERRVHNGVTESSSHHRPEAANSVRSLSELLAGETNFFHSRIRLSVNPRLLSAVSGRAMLSRGHHICVKATS
jgi:hypothetical protein